MSDPRFKDAGDPAVRTLEELAELQKEICKALRFGWFNHHPSENPLISNLDRVRAEMEDVVKAIERLEVHLRALSHAHHQELERGRAHCHRKWPNDRTRWCDHDGPGGFMGHTCVAPDRPDWRYNTDGSENYGMFCDACGRRAPEMWMSSYRCECGNGERFSGRGIVS